MPFDRPFASALAGLEAPLAPSAWDIFSKKFDALPDPADVMPGDAQFRQVLGQVEAPYEAHHWETMRAQIQLAENRKRRVLYVKLAEAAVFLLLFANLALYFVNSDNKNHAGNFVADKADAVKNNTSGLAAKSGNSRSQESLNAGNTNSRSARVVAPVASSVASGNTPATLVPTLVEATTPVAEKIPGLENIAAATITETNITALLNKGEIAVLETPAPALLTAAPGNLSLHQVALPLKVQDPSGWYINNFASTDDNTTVSEGKNSRRRGLSAGLGIGFRRGKWGVESGLAYSEKSYEPKRVLEIYSGNLSDGYYGSYNKGVSADLLTVPLRVTRRLAEGRRLSVQALAGISMNFALSKAYEYKTLYFPGLAPSSQPNPSATPQLRQEGKGLLEGGSLDGNVYATADVGLRGLVKLNRRFSIYIEPSYRRAISKQGIGVRPAQTHTLALCAGVMAAL